MAASGKMVMTAAWVAPMDAPIIHNGAVVIADGRIVAVGPARKLLADHGHGACRQDLPEAILLPGLVNPHTHLELRTCTCGDSAPGSFAEWILSIRQRMREGSPPATDPEQSIRQAVEVGIQQCLRFGVTTVGDISQQMHVTRPLLRDSPIRAVSFGEVIGLARLRWRFDELLPRAVDGSMESSRLRIGLTPHAPYTVDLPGYRQCLHIARQRRLPLATHLAETIEEQQFITHHSGPLRQLWEQIGSWAEPVETFRDGTPVAMAHALGLLEYPTLLAHVNYCDQNDLELLSRGRASVVYCPRTHRYFGHPPHRWREMLARGINLAVGTDSCASSPDLNIVDDLRLLQQIAPQMPSQALWQLATVRAARALGMHDSIGSLTVGKRADLVAFPVAGSDGEDPLGAILSDRRTPIGVWIEGRPPVGAGPPG
ncbi:amidohydrolase family protein [Fontivita pretiosa]|uniref:amidohydrolase family protein n=1 Tax=Fontivita pretiosa TaxID=2989684 RepID=UPI003D177790